LRLAPKEVEPNEVEPELGASKNNGKTRIDFLSCFCLLVLISGFNKNQKMPGESSQGSSTTPHRLQRIVVAWIGD